MPQLFAPRMLDYKRDNPGIALPQVPGFGDRLNPQEVADLPRLASPNRPGTALGDGSRGRSGMPMMPGSSFSMSDMFGRSRTRGRTTTRNRFNNTSRTTPEVTPEYAGLADLLKNQISQKLLDGGLPREYEIKGIKDINQTYDVIGKALENKLSGSGLLSSPVAAAGKTKLEGGRASDIVNMRLGLPGLERSMWGDLFGRAGDLVSRFGLGSTTTQSGESSGEQDSDSSTDYSSSGTNYGQQGADPTSLILNQMGGMAPTPKISPFAAGGNSMMQMLAQFYGMGAFG